MCPDDMKGEKIKFKKTTLVLIYIGSAVMLAVLFLIYPRFFIRQINTERPDTAYFPKQDLKVNIEVASAPADWAKGLMYRSSLDQNAGMLFIFPYESKQAFWMKNTLIPLDIIFISKDKKVVDVKENFQPCPTSKIICPAYGPENPAMYVLEVNASYCAKHNIKIGDEIKFQ